MAALTAVPDHWALAPAPGHRAFAASAGARSVLPAAGSSEAHLLHAAGFACFGGPVLATVDPTGLGAGDVHDALNFAAVLEARLVVVCRCDPGALAALGLAYGIETRAVDPRHAGPVQRAVAELARSGPVGPRLLELSPPDR